MMRPTKRNSSTLVSSGEEEYGNVTESDEEPVVREKTKKTKLYQ